VTERVEGLILSPSPTEIATSMHYWDVYLNQCMSCELLVATTDQMLGHLADTFRMR
jgi:hypothetical protein